MVSSADDFFLRRACWFLFVYGLVLLTESQGVFLSINLFMLQVVCVVPPWIFCLMMFELREDQVEINHNCPLIECLAHLK